MNKVILIGHLAADPESRTTQSGVAQCTLRLAVQRRFTDKQTGQREADFFGEQRIKILDKYGTADESGNYTFEGDNEQKAITELDELLDLEVEPVIDVIDIPITEGIKLSVNDIGYLEPFINFIEES